MSDSIPSPYPAPSAFPRSAVDASLAAAMPALEALLGDRLSTADSIREHHGRDESWHPSQWPDVVCFPESTEEVSKIVAICASHRLPIVPFGAGSSLEGQVIPVAGGLSLDLSRMNRIVTIRPEDLDVTVEAGVTRLQLEKRLHDEGLFFAVDPGADATVGGMAATRASGTNAVRYGTMRENVIQLEVVLADGRVIRTGRRARKSSAGYDLTRLFVGSEGTLGVITELTLRVQGLPEAIASAVVSFPDLGSAVRAAIETIQYGIPVARVELIDGVQMGAFNGYAGTDHAETATLFLEFHGSRPGVEEQSRDCGEIMAQYGGEGFRTALDPKAREELWEARHHAYYASLSLRPGSKGLTTDVCVPLSNLAECIAGTQADTAESFLMAPIVGHVGDGNFHVVFLVDPEKPEEIEEAERLHHRLVQRALALDGTCTGEHGVGLGKQDFLVEEHGTDALDVMRSIKTALDPLGLMNPGKILPAG